MLLQVMVDNRMSAVPILNGEGHCVTPISISDVRFVLQTKDFPLDGTPL